MFPLIDCFLSLIIIVLLFWNGYTQTLLRIALQKHAQPSDGKIPVNLHLDALPRKKPAMSVNEGPKPEATGPRIIERTAPDGWTEYAREEIEEDGDRVQTDWFTMREEAEQADYLTFE